MGRPPCCDKVGVKKGPWTPEEDIMLVSYIQEHGPGNWRSVPTNTGLMRCSKSCRLRWTNYLRPGIKRGNFTDHEEKLIFHLQALLGNRWAAIASYLPERTDNDIKNYWNTHLKKKLRKLQMGIDEGSTRSELSNRQSISKGQWERRLQTDIHTAKQALCDALSFDEISDTKLNNIGNNSSAGVSSTYVWSTDNVSRLLEGWMTNSPKQICCSNQRSINVTTVSNEMAGSTQTGLDSSTPETSETSFLQGESKPGGQQVPFSMLETWLFDESFEQESLLDMSLDDASLLF